MIGLESKLIVMKNVLGTCMLQKTKRVRQIYVTAKLDLSCLDGIRDDLDFCCMLAKEESVIVLPGTFNFRPRGTLDASGFQSLFQFVMST